MGSTILGYGHSVPERRIGNAVLEAQLGLETGWIERRTGIIERRWANDGEALSDLAVAAGEMALEASGIEPEAIALLVLATSTPDHLLPPSAPLVAHRLRLGGAGAIDMAGACAGFLYALTFADAFARTHGAPVLVIAGNILSRRINFEERDSAVIFSDAAGAVVIGPTSRTSAGVQGVTLESDGAHYDLIKIPGGGSRQPFADGMAASETKMRMTDGRAVFRRAVEMAAQTSLAAVEMAGLDIDEVDHWVPHQANARIIAASQAKLGLDDSCLVTSVREFGNSSAATIPLTLSLNSQRFKKGDQLLLTAVGAGLTGGAVLFEL
jgi:3-oxoacyl-[acyl-carrier-protein] synthase-3